MPNSVPKTTSLTYIWAKGEEEGFMRLIERDLFSCKKREERELGEDDLGRVDEEGRRTNSNGEPSEAYVGNASLGNLYLDKVGEMTR